MWPLMPNIWHAVFSALFCSSVKNERCLICLVQSALRGGMVQGCGAMIKFSSLQCMLGLLRCQHAGSSSSMLSTKTTFPKNLFDSKSFAWQLWCGRQIQIICVSSDMPSHLDMEIRKICCLFCWHDLRGVLGVMPLCIRLVWDRPCYMITNACSLSS